ncbi:PIN domain-like protein [Xylaria palmicola]|nr:PIN domain-like protein [Xylaria palmicola]
MGVNGLWTIVQPCARPTNLATLNRKRLAVDASIWIYQFLKAVRDKEGNALRNSHIVGFFRRICKLLWFGILPVFVFDGGAPALKRQTITNRKRRREGRRDDAVRTAGKLLAVQMQRIAEEEGEKRRRRLELEDDYRPDVPKPAEEISDLEDVVYVDELGMSQQERQKSRKFYKQDAYHLPDLNGGIEGMGRPEDPRIMSIEELEDYAKQFHSGEDINLYDFSKIDFEGEFFKSLPPADRYNILNAARIRSRLRMGLSKDQLDGMFPDRMAFSRFQIERVRERNHLTQRLMQEAGMTGTDLTLGVNARIAGDKDREYILVKNDGAEGGWALGVVSREKDRGEIHKPIDVDALDIQYQAKDEEIDWEEDDFEDVPIEGLNRLPTIRATAQTQGNFDDAVEANVEEESLFVGQEGVKDNTDARFGGQTNEESLFQDEEEDLNRAIALSLRNQHGFGSPAQEEIDGEEEEEEFEDVPAPEWTQTAVEQPKPMTSTTGGIIAHIVNNRANAAVPKRRESNASSDSEVDLRTAVSAARKKKASETKSQPKPVSVVPNVQNSFDGPLPFEKLDWKKSIFGKKQETSHVPTETAVNDSDADEDLAGGFLPDAEDDDMPRPLPPWMMQDDLDIRESMKAQQQHEKEINQADWEAAKEEEKRRQRDAIIEIGSSDSENDSDVEIIDPPAPPQMSSINSSEINVSPRSSPATLSRANPPSVVGSPPAESTKEVDAFEEPNGDEDASRRITTSRPTSKSTSPEPDFEEVEVLQPPEELEQSLSNHQAVTLPESGRVLEAELEDQVQEPLSETAAEDIEYLVLGQDEIDDEFSDPEEEELLAQMAEEAEEHARFASQLNNKSEKENQEAYEQELKALRTQQKKDRRDADEVTQIMVTECQALLRYFGIPYIAAPMEAEAQCAELVNLGLVDGIVTDDSDIFLFGGTRVYKNMFNSNKFVECYLSSDMEKELSLSREQLISLAQLLGSDYTEGLPGVGPVTAVEILSEFPGKDGLQKFHDWWQEVQVHNRPKESDQASVFRKKFRKSQATKLFLPPGFPSPAVFDAYLHPEVDHSTEPFQWGSPDVEGLRQFLMATIGWSQERTDEVLVPVIRDMNRREAEGTQSNITRYFEGGVGVGVKEAFAPRQRVQSSKRMAQAVNKLRAHATTDNVSTDGPAADDVSVSRSGERKRKARDTLAADGNVAEQDENHEMNGTRSGKKRGGRGRPRGVGSRTEIPGGRQS